MTQTTYAVAVAALEAAEVRRSDLATQRAKAWTSVVAARAELDRAEASHEDLSDRAREALSAASTARYVLRSESWLAAQREDDAVYALLGGRRWTTDGACMISEDWPLPDTDDLRTWTIPPDSALEILASPLGAPAAGLRLDPRFRRTLAAGHAALGLLYESKDGHHPLGVLDAEGALRAVVMPMPAGAPGILATGADEERPAKGRAYPACHPCPACAVPMPVGHAYCRTCGGELDPVAQLANYLRGIAESGGRLTEAGDRLLNALGVSCDDEEAPEDDLADALLAGADALLAGWGACPHGVDRGAEPCGDCEEGAAGMTDHDRRRADYNGGDP